MSQPNLFRALLAVLPATPLEVGTAVEVTNELVTVELPGGGLLQVRGVADVGDRVFVRGGAIEGPAPSLPIEVILI
ncbi:MAG: hypothetical protein EOO27_23325 [Comamonadaceae bacterium]|nr:MAG: hypothetical protein EOO27_23325 [Comamonadaceae bacterium]